MTDSATNDEPLDQDSQREIVREWKHHLMENYHHYSCKAVNSNSPEGGARLGEEQALNLPHLCGRTLLHDQLVAGEELPSGLELDYIKQTTSKPHLQIRLWLGDEVKKEQQKKGVKISSEFQKEITGFYEQLKAGKKPSHNIPNPLPIRLKQLLLPTSDGDFISVTPLPCLQVAKDFSTTEKQYGERSRELRKALKKESTPETEKELASTPRLAKIISMPVGGSNFQNVGSQARYYQSPLIFDQLPKTTPAERQAFGIAYNGLQLRFPKQLVVQYLKFLEKTRLRLNGTDKWTSRDVKAEEYYLLRLAASWQKQAKEAGELLDSVAGRLPVPLPYISSGSPSEVAQFEGWLNPIKRDANWVKSEAEAMVATLQDETRLGKNSEGEQITLALSRTDKARIIKSIRSRKVL